MKLLLYLILEHVLFFLQVHLGIVYKKNIIKQKKKINIVFFLYFLS